MIAFGVSITRPEVYGSCAQPGLKRAAEPDSEIYAMPAAGSIFTSYNRILDTAAERDDLEALVLVHQDTEIVDADLCPKLRNTLADPEVGIVGCVGAIGVRSIAWWEGSVTLASFVNRYLEHGGGDLPAFSWAWDEAPPYAQVGEVETLDGFLLALSPWAVRNVRFDESLGGFHGYDLDYCLQLREAGRKVMTADFRAIHHRPLEMIVDQEEWIQAHVAVADKWDGRMGISAGPGDWRERALRAQAERDAAKTLAYTSILEGTAELAQVQRGLDEARASISWRITAPLRWLSR